MQLILEGTNEKLLKALAKQAKNSGLKVLLKEDKKKKVAKKPESNK